MRCFKEAGHLYSEAENQIKIGKLSNTNKSLQLYSRDEPRWHKAKERDLKTLLDPNGDILRSSGPDFSFSFATNSTIQDYTHLRTAIVRWFEISHQRLGN